MTPIFAGSPEVDQELFSGESIHNLHSIDNADASHTLGVVRAQQQSQLNELVTTHAQLACHILHTVLLHILLPLKDVPASWRKLAEMHMGITLHTACLVQCNPAIANNIHP